MEKDLDELHNLANVTFQNVTNLTPALKQVVANAKVYQKSVQATCNIAVMFIDSIQNIANAANVSEGATKKLGNTFTLWNVICDVLLEKGILQDVDVKNQEKGTSQNVDVKNQVQIRQNLGHNYFDDGEVLVDIMDAFKEIENMKLELTKLFINEVIIPLESRSELEVSNMKTTHKSYNTENKNQTELTEKARTHVSKTRKKSMKKKKSVKLEEKEKIQVQTLDEAEKKLRQVREEGLRKALIEERRAYCFVAERMCTYGRGMVIYNNRISNFVNQKLPDWQQFISRPTELPPDSEDIISNPTGYKMGTVQRKISKKNSIRRAKSFSNNHFQTKYSTVDGRASRGGSRPSLSAMTMNSSTNLSMGSLSGSPSRKAPGSPSFAETHNTSYPTPPMSTDGGDARGISPSPEPTMATYHPPVHEQVQENRSEYANLVVLNKPVHDSSVSAQGRSHSFTVPKQQMQERKVSLNRTESSATDMMRGALTSTSSSNGECDFASKLAQIQSQLSQKLNDQPPDPSSKSRLKAIYDHEAQDASQLDFAKDDIIIPICEETSGWQYGENEKTAKSGWFPAAYCEEILISSTGEEQAKPAPVHTGATASRKKPPPVAKKSSRIGVNRKISVACGPLTKPPRTYAEQRHDSNRRNSLGELPVMSTSSSMPQIVHMVNEEKELGHERKHSNSFQGLDFTRQDSLNSFDDSVDEDSLPASPTTSGENSPRKRSHGNKNKKFDAMPPPPPPPPPYSDDEDLNTPPLSPPPPPPQDGNDVIIITNGPQATETHNPFAGISFKKTKNETHF